MYVPKDPPEAIVFAGDGQMISQWGGILEAADLPPTMIDWRAPRGRRDAAGYTEYSPKFDPERFAAHERFFVEDVGAWARSRFGVTLPQSARRCLVFRRVVALALAIGLRHPDRYGAIFSASPARGYRPPDVMPSSLPRTYLVAGTQEPFFLDNTGSMGGRAPRCSCGRRDERASRRARRHDVARSFR